MFTTVPTGCQTHLPVIYVKTLTISLKYAQLERNYERTILSCFTLLYQAKTIDITILLLSISCNDELYISTHRTHILIV